MGSFLKDNWIWIAGPLIVILVGVGVLIAFDSMDGGGDGDGGFIYDLF